MNTPTYNRLNKDDAVVLLVDHQTGLISLVQDFSPNEFKNNVLALADEILAVCHAEMTASLLMSADSAEVPG